MNEKPMIAFGVRSLRVTAAEGISCQNKQAASRSSNQLDKILYPAPSMMDDGRLFMACSSFGDDNDSVATSHDPDRLNGPWPHYHFWDVGLCLRGKMGV